MAAREPVWGSFPPVSGQLGVQGHYSDDVVRGSRHEEPVSVPLDTDVAELAAAGDSLQRAERLLDLCRLRLGELVESGRFHPAQNGVPDGLEGIHHLVKRRAGVDLS